MTRIFLIILIFGGCACNLQAQPPSFYKKYTGELYTTILPFESIDGGFLYSSSGRVHKINKLGEEEWIYKTQASADLVDLGFTNIYTDSLGIYLFGYLNFGTPYYARLDLNGKLQFDTAFYDWNIEGEEIHNIRSVTFDGDAIVLIGNYFHNLEVVDTSNGNNQWIWDKQCYKLIRFDKMNCNRLSSVYDFFTEDTTLSHYPYGTTVRVNTSDKGLLNVAALAKTRFNPSLKQSFPTLIRTDSVGRVTGYKSFFEHPVFQNFNLDTDVSRYPIASWAWEKGAESRHPVLFRNYKLYDGVCIKMALNNAGTWSTTNNHEYLVFYNTEGEFEKIVRLDTFTEPGLVCKYDNIFEFRDSNKNLVWTKSIDLNTNTHVAQTYFNSNNYRTSYGGLIFTYYVHHPDDFNTKTKFIYYLNPNGWGVNVPKIEGKEGLASPWFDAQGSLVLPETFSDWELSLMDVTGKQVSHSSTLSSGVYIVQLHNPSTGEQRYWKVFKE